MFEGFPPAPRWAWAVMALGVAAIVVLTYLTLNRPPPPAFPGSVAASSAGPERSAPPPSPAPPTETTPAPDVPETADVPRILVVGDALTTPSPDWPGWPELVRADLDAAGRQVDLTVAAADGAGYVQPGPGGATFPRLAQQAGGDFDLVVFFGSRHDVAAAADIAAATDRAFAAARAASPTSGLVVIGPAWPTPDPPGYIETNRDVLGAAAVRSGARFVDPLTEGWLTGTAGGSLTPDGRRLTAQGHRDLANLIRPVIEQALPAAT